MTIIAGIDNTEKVASDFSNAQHFDNVENVTVHSRFIQQVN